jgi:polygalacturonase
MAAVLFLQPIRVMSAAAQLAPPAGLTAPALARTASTILLVWDKSPSPGVAAYEVFRDGVRVANTPRLHYIATNLAANTTYHFSVRAADGSGKLSAECNQVRAGTRPGGPVCNVREYGAKGDGTNRDGPAIQKAIDACVAGGIVLVPPGDYLVEHLELKSDLTVQLSAGATLRFLGRDEGNYPTTTVHLPGPDGELTVSNRALIAGVGVANVAIIGEGTIFANGATWWPNPKLLRPCVLGLVLASNVLVQGITLADPPRWNAHALYVDDAVFAEVKFVKRSTAPGTNGDGLDPDSSRKVLVVGCTFANQDDSIAIKSGRVSPEQPKRQRSCEDIVVRDCLIDGSLAPGAHPLGFAVGSETCGGVRRVLVKDCVFKNAASLMNIKGNRERLQAVVEDIRVENCAYTNRVFRDEPWNRAPITVDLFYYDRPEDPNAAAPLTPATPLYRNIRFQDLIIENSAGRAVYLCGLKECPVTGLSFSNITASAKSGLFGRNLDGVALERVIVNAQTGAPFEWENVKGVKTLER